MTGEGRKLPEGSFRRHLCSGQLRVFDVLLFVVLLFIMLQIVMLQIIVVQIIVVQIIVFPSIVLQHPGGSETRRLRSSQDSWLGELLKMSGLLVSPNEGAKEGLPVISQKLY